MIAAVRGQGPYSLPMFGFTGIAARTDYLVSGPSTCTLFLTAAKADGEEGRIFCTRTTDGGKSFDLLSPIGPEPSGFAIMPASLRLSPTRILCRRPLLRAPHRVHHRVPLDRPLRVR